MIHLCSSAITVLSQDGTTRIFEPEELQANLLRSFLSCGIRDSWMAEDIALSVEAVLNQVGGNEKIFTLSEINSSAVKVLEQAGLSEIAVHFQRQNQSRIINIKPESDLLSTTITKYLGITGKELREIVSKIQSGCKTLNIDNASLSLILELAKHYRAEKFEEKAIDIPIRPFTSDSPWCVTIDEITSGITDSAKTLLNAKILSICPISKLFPAVKLDIKLENLAILFKIEAPLTELALVPHFKRLSASINEIIAVEEKFYERFLKNEGLDSGPALPVYLKITDAPAFSEKYLGINWPEAADCLYELISFLMELLERKVYIRNIPITRGH